MAMRQRKANVMIRIQTKETEQRNVRHSHSGKFVRSSVSLSLSVSAYLFLKTRFFFVKLFEVQVNTGT